MSTKIRFQQFACSPNGNGDHGIYCGHVWNLAEEADGTAPRTQVTCDFPQHARTDEYAIARGIEYSGTFSILCPECGATGHGGKKIAGQFGKTACEQACETATGSQCKCQCGGMNHGIRS